MFQTEVNAGDIFLTILLVILLFVFQIQNSQLILGVAGNIFNNKFLTILLVILLFIFQIQNSQLVLGVAGSKEFGVILVQAFS